MLTDLEPWGVRDDVAAVLAPTDAALGQAVVSNPQVPAHVREALDVESGLNDGGLGAVPHALHRARGRPGRASRAAALRFTVEQIGLEGSSSSVAVIAFVLADAAGGNGFIAAFVAGLRGAAWRPGRCAGMSEFAEEEGELRQGRGVPHLRRVRRRRAVRGDVAGWRSGETARAQPDRESG